MKRAPTKQNPIMSKKQIYRFLSKIDDTSGLGPNGDCWEWSGSRQKYGYGSIGINGKVYKAHRIAYELLKGPTGDFFVLHTCDNPPCCNPDHLWLGTQADNIKDCKEKGRTRNGVGAKHGSKTHPQRIPRGEKSGLSVLTRSDVEEIRAKYQTGDFSQGLLGEQYGVSRTTVGQIVRGETWTHIS